MINEQRKYKQQLARLREIMNYINDNPIMDSFDWSMREVSEATIRAYGLLREIKEIFREIPIDELAIADVKEYVPELLILESDCELLEIDPGIYRIEFYDEMHGSTYILVPLLDGTAVYISRTAYYTFERGRWSPAWLSHRSSTPDEWLKEYQFTTKRDGRIWAFSFVGDHLTKTMRMLEIMAAKGPKFTDYASCRWFFAPIEIKSGLALIAEYENIDTGSTWCLVLPASESGTIVTKDSVVSWNAFRQWSDKQTEWSDVDEHD